MVGGASRDRRPAQVRWAAAGRPDNFSSIRHYHQYAESGGYWIRGSVRFLTNMHLRKQASTHNESLKDQSGSVVPHRHLCPAGRRSSTLSGADPSAVAPVKRGDLRTDLRSRSNLMNDRSCREDHQKAPQQHCDQKPTRASSCQPANSAAKARNPVSLCHHGTSDQEALRTRLSSLVTQSLGRPEISEPMLADDHREEETGCAIKYCRRGEPKAFDQRPRYQETDR
jgi:hypothetical protein